MLFTFFPILSVCNFVQYTKGLICIVVTLSGNVMLSTPAVPEKESVFTILNWFFNIIFLSFE